MKGYYLEQTKQEIYTDWKAFASKNLVPHTQTCDNCYMVLEINKLNSLKAGLRGSSYRTTGLYLYFICPGCKRANAYTGGAHLSPETNSKLTNLYYSIPGGVDEFTFFKQDYSFVFYTLRFLWWSIMAILVGLIAGAIFF